MLKCNLSACPSKLSLGKEAGALQTNSYSFLFYWCLANYFISNKVLLGEEGLIGIANLQRPQSIWVLDAYRDCIADMIKKIIMITWKKIQQTLDRYFSEYKYPLQVLDVT